jgi:hypothetical protein
VGQYDFDIEPSKSISFLIRICHRDRSGSRPDEVDFFNLPNPSGRTMALGSTQPVTEMVPGILKKKPEDKGRPARRADNLAAMLAVSLSNVGASTSRKSRGLHGL